MTAISQPETVMVPFRGVSVHPSIVTPLKSLLSHHPTVRVSSGWRSPARNLAVGGVPRSRHLAGVAADLVADRRTLAHLASAARRYGAVEVLMEADHLHVGWPRP